MLQGVATAILVSYCHFVKLWFIFAEHKVNMKVKNTLPGVDDTWGPEFSA